MENQSLRNGLAVLGAGLLASSISSFLETIAVFGSSTEFIRGFFDGISVIAFGAAIILLVRSQRMGGN